jgi:hypothetical protein
MQGCFVEDDTQGQPGPVGEFLASGVEGTQITDLAWGQMRPGGPTCCRGVGGCGQEQGYGLGGKDRDGDGFGFQGQVLARTNREQVAVGSMRVVVPAAVGQVHELAALGRVADAVQVEQGADMEGSCCGFAGFDAGQGTPAA